MPLNAEQSARLMQLFRFSPTISSLPTAQVMASEPTIWHPVLTDIHDQVVHTISPVLVRQQVALAGLPPTLSLILLAPPTAQSTPQIGAVNSQGVTDQLVPIPKQTL
ncbi:hypothetical protein [Fibrella aquatilis]|uniref:Uncharacterized protein n=1 Tax=Fibrella aquatilis TaxID=2817059 RepID=A0A939G897_9BACT|nr:hypothetical protein [Fibrella aquatilis]MBO0931896.1 hypothetical protein [Fibrella aquatilis]